MPRNRSSTICECGKDFVETIGRIGANLLSEDDYFSAIGASNSPCKNNGGAGWGSHGETRFHKIVCPFCAVEYVGWYRYRVYDGAWTLLDTSYWSSFDDEPGEADVRNRHAPAFASCGRNNHLKSYDTGSWNVGGFAPGTHRCPCGGDGVVWAVFESGYDGLRFKTDVAFCVACAAALRDALDCEIEGAKKVGAP